MGFVKPDLPYYHPDFGKPIRCPGESHNAQYVAHYEERTGLVAVEFDLRLDKIQPRHGNVDLLKSLVEFTKNPWDIGWIYLWGRWGNGKTALLKALVSEFVFGESKKHGLSAMYINYPDFVGALRGTWGTSENEGQIFESVTSKSLLVVDELDKEAKTDNDMKYIFKLMDRRYQMYLREQGITVFCSNKHPKSFMSPAELSRLSHNGFRIICNAAADERPKSQDVGRRGNTSK